jgi:hypothetical protein
MEYNSLEEQIKEYINPEKIINKLLFKRLLKESRFFSNYFVSLSLKYENNNYLLYLKDKSNYKYNNYCFVIDIHYPFKQPKLLINDIPYKNFLINSCLKYRNLLKKMYNINCLCCNTSLCSEKWSPAITIINIIEEIFNFRSYKQNIIYKIMIDKIKDKYLILDIDLESWLY